MMMIGVNMRTCIMLGLLTTIAIAAGDNNWERTSKKLQRNGRPVPPPPPLPKLSMSKAGKVFRMWNTKFGRVKHNGRVVKIGALKYQNGFPGVDVQYMDDPEKKQVWRPMDPFLRSRNIEMVDFVEMRKSGDEKSTKELEAQYLGHELCDPYEGLTDIIRCKAFKIQKNKGVQNVVVVLEDGTEETRHVRSLDELIRVDEYPKWKKNHDEEIEKTANALAVSHQENLRRCRQLMIEYKKQRSGLDKNASGYEFDRETLKVKIHELDAEILKTVGHLEQLDIEYEGEEQGDAECCLCFEKMCCRLNRKLKCGHTFHQACINKHLVRKRNCPLCRADVDSNDFEHEDDYAPEVKPSNSEL